MTKYHFNATAQVFEFSCNIEGTTEKVFKFKFKFSKTK